MTVPKTLLTEISIHHILDRSALCSVYRESLKPGAKRRERFTVKSLLQRRVCHPIDNYNKINDYHATTTLMDNITKR